jgi:hypothetical protein
MSGFDLWLILVLGAGFALISEFGSNAPTRLRNCFIYGGGVALFGLATAAFVKQDFFAVLLLHDTSGFGRAYVGGLGIVAAAPLILAIRFIVFLLGRIRR